MQYRVLLVLLIVFLLSCVVHDRLQELPSDRVVHDDKVDENRTLTDKTSGTHENLQQTKQKKTESIKQKKERFFAFLLPLVKEENTLLLEQRRAVKVLFEAWKANGILESTQLQQLRDLLIAFKLPDDAPPGEDMFLELLSRVDVIPISLALSQAANESAWGTSRFAREGNNYFGQWCFKKGCGLVPVERSEDASHEVAKFDSVRASVKSYLKNINTFSAYQELRDMRADMRLHNRIITGEQLAVGLLGYSQRGAAYVEELQAMIRVNGLRAWDEQFTHAANDYLFPTESTDESTNNTVLLD